MQIERVPESQYVIPKELLWVFILTMAIVLQYVATMYTATMSARIKSFTRAFMEQFDEEHREAFPGKERAPEWGYPDTGNGRFGKKLPYADWFRMGNGQRCQINFLEHLHFLILSPIIVALWFPIVAIVLQCVIFVGRLMFTIGYTFGGPSKRIFGAITMDLAIFVSFGFMVAACIKLAI